MVDMALDGKRLLAMSSIKYEHLTAFDATCSPQHCPQTGRQVRGPTGRWHAINLKRQPVMK